MFILSGRVWQYKNEILIFHEKNWYLFLQTTEHIHRLLLIWWKLDFKFDSNCSIFIKQKICYYWWKEILLTQIFYAVASGDRMKKLEKLLNWASGDLDNQENKMDFQTTRQKVGHFFMFVDFIDESNVTCRFD